MAKPHPVLVRLERARSLIRQGRGVPCTETLLTEAISELSAYNSLRSRVEAEVERLQVHYDQADRLQAILDSTGTEGEGKG